jgi:putative flippase GtrA
MTPVPFQAPLAATPEPARPLSLRSQKRASRTTELWRFLKGQASSIAATGTDWVVMRTTLALDGHYSIAIALGFLSGAILDFCVKRFWVFKAHTHIGKQLGLYVSFGAIGLSINEALAYVAIDRYGLPKFASIVAISIVVGLGFTYPTHRFFVFKATKPTTA